MTNFEKELRREIEEAHKISKNPKEKNAKYIKQGLQIALNIYKNSIKRLRCCECKKFISKKDSQATIREPHIFYCNSCYEKGLEIEKEAMGYNDNLQF
jgi:hypothetical protein